MESKELKISAENALTAYKNADENSKELLENLFGKEVFLPPNVMERVRTFEDACRELGENHPLVKSYEALSSVDTDNNLEAYVKLRVIVAALNEKWEPSFSTNENRFYPWFNIYTQEEVGEMSEENNAKLRLVGCSLYNRLPVRVVASSNYTWSRADAFISVHLALKNRELAEYCGKQFIEIWSDYLFKL